MKVCKFGGTSMADSDAIEAVVKIINDDSSRRFIVVSAPGKRFRSDTKITDALYNYFATGCENFDFIKNRFSEIAEGLGLGEDVSALLDGVKDDIKRNGYKDFAASRGEYLSARLLASKLGAEFIDADALIRFDGDGNLLLDESLAIIKNRLKGVRVAVLPGFYGSMPDGRIKTFSRGGSDITGAIVARAVGASVYENWTDVDGFLAADPRIVRNPDIIECLNFGELRELAYMGAEVLHPESIYPVRHVGIPINIKNTFNPSHPGTMIVADCKVPMGKRTVTGIAGKKGFTIINIEKDMMNGEIGFGRRALQVLEEENISFEHMPSGIDTLSVVLRDEYLPKNLTHLVSRLEDALKPDKIEVHSGLSLIATVGHNMAARQGTAARLFKALGDSNINVRMIDQGSSEMNIIVGVDTFDYEKAINAIYYGFKNCPEE